LIGDCRALELRKQALLAEGFRGVAVADVRDPLLQDAGEVGR
jgi:hypothetical protein